MHDQPHIRFNWLLGFDLGVSSCCSISRFLKSGLHKKNWSILCGLPAKHNGTNRQLGYFERVETSYWGETGLGQRTGVVKVSLVQPTRPLRLQFGFWELCFFSPIIFFNSLYPSGLLITAVSACVRERASEIWEY